MVAGSRDQWVSIFQLFRFFKVQLQITSVDAQWITAKKDWQEAKRRYKMQQKAEGRSAESAPEDASDSGRYQERMDEMRCILYAHGGNPLHLLE